MRNTQAMKIRKAPLIFSLQTVLSKALGKGAEGSVCGLGSFTRKYKMECPLINTEQTTSQNLRGRGGVDRKGRGG